jgi:hypothetical protein
MSRTIRVRRSPLTAWPPRERSHAAILALLILLIVLTVLPAGSARAQTPIGYGETAVGEIATVGEADVFEFDATAGDRVILRLADTSSPGEPHLSLMRPNGTLMNDVYDYTLAELDAIELTIGGTYTVRVHDHGNDETFAYCLHLQCLNAAAAPEPAPYGSTVAGSLPLAAATHAFTFNGSLGERVLVRLVQADGSVYPTIRIYDPTGVRIGSTHGNPLAELDEFELTTSGTFTILALDHYGTNTGDVVLHVQRPGDPVGAGTIAYGQTLTGSLGALATTLTYRFDTSVGDRILVRLAELGSSIEPVVRIYDSQGLRLTAATDYTLAEINAFQPGAAGTYTILVTEGHADETDDVSLHLQCTNDPAGAEAIVPGAVHSGEVAARAATVAYTFDLQADDRVLLRLARTGSSFYPLVRVYTPDGQPLLADHGSPLAEINAAVVPATGTYTVLALDYYGTNTDGIRLHGRRLNDPAGAVAMTYGQTRAGTLAERAITDAHRLTAAAGDRVLVRLAETTSDLEPTIRLYDPQGDEVVDVTDYSLAEVNALQLPASGTYTLLACDSHGDETGTYSLHVQRTHGAAGAVGLPFGTTLPGDLAAPGATVPYTVSVAAGDRLLLRLVRGGDGMYPRLRVYRPDGQMLAQQHGSPLAEFNGLVITEPGVHTLLAMDYYGGGTQAIRIHAQRLNDPALATTIAYGTTIAGELSDLAHTDAYTFSGDTADRILARHCEGESAIEPTLRLYGPSGEQVAGADDYSLAELEAIALPSSGPYTLLALEGHGDEVGPYSLHLQRTHAAAGAVPLEYGETVAGTLAEPAASLAFSVPAAAGQRLLVRTVRDGDGMYPQLRIYDPTGERIVEAHGSPLAEVDPCEPEASGEYTILVTDYYGGGVCDLAVHAQRLDDPRLAIPIDYTTSRVDTLTMVAQTRAYTFTAAGGDTINARMIEIPSLLEPSLRLYDPDGVRLAAVTDYSDVTLGFRLPASGTYTLLALEGHSDEIGAYQLNLSAIAVGVEDFDGPITAFALRGNYPNPFNPRTTIVFDLPAAARVRLDIMGIDGRRVCRVVDRVLPTGRHRVVWDGCDGRGRPLASGTYVAVVQSGADRQAQRIALVR